jgi:hypothetical protein
MGSKMIAVEMSFAAWRNHPEYEKGYNAVRESSLEAAIIGHADRAHARAGADSVPRKQPREAAPGPHSVAWSFIS